jgi:hypothetical protein
VSTRAEDCALGGNPHYSGNEFRQRVADFRLYARALPEKSRRWEPEGNAKMETGRPMACIASCWMPPANRRPHSPCSAVAADQRVLDFFAPRCHDSIAILATAVEN